MSNLGDFTEDYPTLNTKFTTVNTAGVPTVLTAGVISVYKSNSTTQSVAGITLTVDFDGIVGNNHVLIDLSADAFYAIGNDYQIVITTGTVDGSSVVGYVVREFSIENRFGFTAVEIAQIRHRLNLDGTQTAPTAGGAAKMVGIDANMTLNTLVVNRTDSGTAVRFSANGGSSNGLLILANGNAAGMRTEGGSSSDSPAGGNSAVGFQAQGGAGTNAAGLLGAGGDGTPGGVGAHFDGALGSGPDVDGLLLESQGDGRDISAKELFLPAYPDEIIYFNKTSGSSGTAFAIDGVSDNGVNLEADARTLAISHGAKKIGIQNGTYQIVGGGGSAYTGFSLMGLDGSANLDLTSGTSVAFSKISNMKVATDVANGITSSDGVLYENCEFTTGMFPVSGSSSMTLKRCELMNDAIGYNSNGLITAIDCYSKGSDVVILDAVGVSCIWNVKRYVGNLNFVGSTGGNAHTIHMQGGTITIDASCTTGTLVLTGWGNKPIDNSGAGFTVNDSGYQTLPATTLVAFQKNTAFANFPIYMVDDTNHPVGKPGLSVAGTTSKDGAGTLTPLTNAVTELGFGFYRVDLTQAEMNGDVVNLRFTASGASDRVVSFPTNV